MDLHPSNKNKSHVGHCVYNLHVRQMTMTIFCRYKIGSYLYPDCEATHGEGGRPGDEASPQPRPPRPALGSWITVKRIILGFKLGMN